MKTKSIAKWKKEFWRLFSQFIRLRDAYKCFTCGRVGSGSGIHAGHYIPRAAGGLRLYFHERNVHAQCYHCNINLSGNSDIYGQKLEQKYGKKVLTTLRKLRDLDVKDPLQFTAEDYQKLMKKYQAKMKKLLQKPGVKLQVPKVYKVEPVSLEDLIKEERGYEQDYL